MSDREKRLWQGYYNSAKQQLGSRMKEVEESEVVVVCPRCGEDVPSHDLRHFVRFYDGDEGYTVCRNCHLPILWTMSIRELDL